MQDEVTHRAGLYADGWGVVTRGGGEGEGDYEDDEEDGGEGGSLCAEEDGEEDEGIGEGEQCHAGLFASHCQECFVSELAIPGVGAVRFPRSVAWGSRSLSGLGVEPAVDGTGGDAEGSGDCFVGLAGLTKLFGLSSHRSYRR